MGSSLGHWCFCFEAGDSPWSKIKKKEHGQLTQELDDRQNGIEN